MSIESAADDYTRRLISLVESGKGIFTILDVKGFKKVIRETKNIQVMSLQSFMYGFGMSLSTTEKILRHPLSPEYDLEKLHTDLLTIARAKVAPEEIFSLDKSIISKGFDSYGYMYSLVSSCFTNACYSEKLGRKLLSSDITDADTAFLTPIMFSEVTPDPVFLPFEVIVEAVDKMMEERGFSRSALVSKLRDPYRYHVDKFLDGRQHSCGIRFINDIADGLDTTSSNIYLKAEDILRRKDAAS